MQSLFLIASIMLCCVGALQAQPGFKEFRLHAMRHEVDSILQATKWHHYVVRELVDSAGIRIEYLQGSYTSDSLHNEMWGIACTDYGSYRTCATADVIDLEFYHDTLYRITLTSRAPE